MSQNPDAKMSSNDSVLKKYLNEQSSSILLKPKRKLTKIDYVFNSRKQSQKTASHQHQSFVSRNSKVFI